MTARGPHPDSLVRDHPEELSRSLPPVGSKARSSLEWMFDQPRGVTTEDAVEQNLHDGIGAAGHTLGRLYKETVFVDRVAFKKRYDSGATSTAHVYWLTDAGEAAIAATIDD